MPEIISLDWLQLHVRSVADTYPLENGTFTMVRQPFHTKQFKNVDYIYENGEGVATLVGIPHSGILKPDSGLLKIENKYLYQKDVRGLVERIISNFRLTFVNVTRVDIACDFNSFANNLNPENFILRFLDGTYVKLKKSSFSVYGMHQRYNDFQYLRFGSATSTLCYYLYNKTLELRERKKKPYIEQLWRDKGLKSERDVWRLEFRITSSQRGLCDVETGEALPFYTLDVIDRYNEVYGALFYKYMDFRLEDGQKKKDRMKPVPLLHLERPTLNYMRLIDKIDSNRMDKIFISKLVALNNELRGTDFSLNVESQKLLNRFVDSRDLLLWFEKKFPLEYERMRLTPEHSAMTNTIL